MIPPQDMTMREWLAWTYPLHFQRIVEEGYRQCEREGFDFTKTLDGKPGPYPLAGCFTWAKSEEGHEYWQRLSGEPFKGKGSGLAIDWQKRITLR